MAAEISRIFIGLPEELVHLVKWVALHYRINPLSFTEGGSDIIIEYHSGEVLGYDHVKYPSLYIDEIIRTLFPGKREVLIEEIGTKISKIYLRPYDTEQEYKLTPFEEIWSSSRIGIISILAVKHPVIQAKDYMDKRWRKKQKNNPFKKTKYKRW